MEIRAIEPPPAPLKKRTPAQMAKGRKTITVSLEKPITLQIAGSFVVTYPIGLSDVPCEVANALFEAGADKVGPDGTFIKRAARKPQSLWPTPTRGGIAGSMRYR